MKIKKIINSIKKTLPIIIFGLLMAWLFDTGSIFKWGLIGLIIFSIIIAGFRIYMQWEQYKATVDMGAEHLRLMKQMKKVNDEQKEQNK